MFIENHQCHSKLEQVSGFVMSFCWCCSFFLIYSCVMFPQLCSSSSRLHLNYTLALLESGKLSFSSRGTEEMLSCDVRCV